MNTNEYWVTIDNGEGAVSEERVNDAYFCQRVIKDGVASFPEIPARVFAAAPDLLETCKLVLENLEGMTARRELEPFLRNVIAKAEGRE